MSNVIETKQNIQNTTSMLFSMVQMLITDETLLDEVQDKINRVLDIVKNKSPEAKIPNFSSEVSKDRTERRKKEKNKDKEVTNDGTTTTEPTKPVATKATRKSNGSKRKSVQ